MFCLFLSIFTVGQTGIPVILAVCRCDTDEDPPVTSRHNCGAGIGLQAHTHECPIILTASHTALLPPPPLRSSTHAPARSAAVLRIVSCWPHTTCTDASHFPHSAWARHNCTAPPSHARTHAHAAVSAVNLCLYVTTPSTSSAHHAAHTVCPTHPQTAQVPSSTTISLDDLIFPGRQRQRWAYQHHWHRPEPEPDAHQHHQPLRCGRCH